MGLFDFVFGKRPKPPTAAQQASVGYYDENTPFGSTEWIKNPKKGGAGYIKQTTLSPNELAKLAISDKLRDNLADFSKLFEAQGTNYNPLGDDFSPFDGNMFQAAQLMAPGLAAQNRFNQMGKLQGQLNYQPMYTPSLGSSGMTGVQHQGTPGKRGLLGSLTSALGPIGKLASVFANPASGSGFIM